MDWWDQVGNMADMFPDTPALAVDMALHGPDADFIGYGLAYGLQSTATPIDVYPDESSPAGLEG
ncbi:hypothetical protein AB0942_33245 [Streptomyces nodosus]|uniref:hypothetical protein n=1 Tax=Streptomyces nodosus TaxID=40318 RepID=UPI003453009B